MWKMWITSGRAGSIFAVRTDFERKRGELHTLSTPDPVENCGNPEICQVCTILQNDAVRQSPTERSPRFSVGIFCAARFAYRAKEVGRESVSGRFSPSKNPAPGTSDPLSRRERAPGAGFTGKPTQGSVKVSSSTSVWVLFFISRRNARRDSSSLSPRISV